MSQTILPCRDLRLPPTSIPILDLFWLVPETDKTAFTWLAMSTLKKSLIELLTNWVTAPKKGWSNGWLEGGPEIPRLDRSAKRQCKQLIISCLVGTYICWCKRQPYTDLTRVALTARSFLHRTQFHLFQSIDVDPSRSHCIIQNSQNWDAFHTILLKSPTIKFYIQEIFIFYEEGYRLHEVDHQISYRCPMHSVYSKQRPHRNPHNIEEILPTHNVTYLCRTRSLTSRSESCYWTWPIPVELGESLARYLQRTIPQLRWEHRFCELPNLF